MTCGKPRQQLPSLPAGARLSAQRRELLSSLCSPTVYPSASTPYLILRRNSSGSAFLPTFLLLQMTHWYWWIPTHASKSRQKQRQLAPPQKNAASCAQKKPSRQSDLHLTCSIQKLFILPRLHAPMRSKVAAYSAMHDSQESSLCALESVIVLALSCTVDTQMHTHWCVMVLTALSGHLQKFRLDLNLRPCLPPMPRSWGWF